MSVLLLAIEFNHDPLSATSDAMTLRRNADEAIQVPEWQLGRSIRPDDSPVAYAIRETRGNTITIRANFARTDASLTAVEVRAVPAPLSFSAPLLQLLLRPLLIWPAYYFAVYQYLAQLTLPPARSILGEVRQRQILFGSGGESGFQTFELEGVRLGVDGVAAADVFWLWQYRDGPLSQWRDIGLSSHRVFAVLEVPKEPWVQQPGDASNTQLPWADVLEFSCSWAQGAFSLDEAADRVTRAVINLGSRFGPEFGQPFLEYGCEILGLSQYSFPYFNCTKFLDRLQGGLGNGAFVNCSDCATIVSTFANALGCDLWQSTMGIQPVGFELNPILAIGKSTWDRACGWGFFTYHEVAWTGACMEQDDVFDACLYVNGGPDPTRWPFVPVLPADVRFGEPGDGRYRDRLAAPLYRAACEPQPQTRQRRFVV